MRLSIIILLSLLPIFCISQTKSKIPFPVEKFLKGKIRTADVAAYLQYHSAKKTITAEKLNKDIQVKHRGDEDEIMIHDAERSESEVYAAINPLDTNKIVIASINQDPTSLEKPLYISIYHSEDFGASWHQSEFDGWLENFTLPIGGGDPILTFDENGRVYLTWLILDGNIATFTGTLGIYFAFSDDNGNTWTINDDPVDISSEFNLLTLEGVEYLLDKPWMITDKSETVQNGSTYMCFTKLKIDKNSYVTYDIILRRKKGESQSFETEEFIIGSKDDFKFMQFSNMDYSLNGDLHAVFIGSPDSTNFGLYYTKASNSDLVFSDPIKISDIHLPSFTNDDNYEVSGIDPDRLYPCPMIKTNKNPNSSSIIHCTWTANGIHNAQSESLDIYISTSTNGGQYWSEGNILNNDSGQDNHQYYASLATGTGGVVVASFYDRRDDVNNNLTHQYIAISENDGLTFDEQIPVSSNSTDFSQIGILNGNFGIGEYTVTLMTANTAMPIWSDGRKNNGDINIYMAKVGYEGGAVGIKEINQVSDKLIIHPIRPNPVQEKLTLSIECVQKTNGTIQIYDVHGQRVFSSDKLSIDENFPLYTIDCSSFPAGSYILHVETDLSKKSVVFQRAK